MLGIQVGEYLEKPPRIPTSDKNRVKATGSLKLNHFLKSSL